jgi:hypothetical protein
MSCLENRREEEERSKVNGPLDNNNIVITGNNTIHILSNFAIPTMIRYFSKTETAIDNVVIQSTIEDCVQAALVARFDSRLFQKKKQ